MIFFQRGPREKPTYASVKHQGNEPIKLNITSFLNSYLPNETANYKKDGVK